MRKKYSMFRRFTSNGQNQVIDFAFVIIGLFLYKEKPMLIYDDPPRQRIAVASIKSIWIYDFPPFKINIPTYLIGVFWNDVLLGKNGYMRQITFKKNLQNTNIISPGTDFLYRYSCPPLVIFRNKYGAFVPASITDYGIVC